MAFDSDLANDLLIDDDRDHARFFAGRAAEIESFNGAVEQAGRKEQAVFRIFQGAPGCGKTSLASHLRAHRSVDVLFVALDNEDLASREALAARIKEEAEDTANLGVRITATTLRAVAEAFKATSVSEQIDKRAGALARRGKTVVLHLDEAQTVSEREADVLRGLHGRGLGVPCVFLFTGLSHTGDRIRGLDGLSRLARDATINMGRMADAECEASTAMMLEKPGVEAAEAVSREAVGVVVEGSYGWPQHLSCAQQAVCRELVRTNGDLEGVDLDRLRAESTVARHAYYAGRTSYGELARWPALVAAVASQVMANRANTEPELTKLCRGEIRRLTLHADQDFTAEPLDFVRQMVEKGVLSFAPDGRYIVPIPSMLTWLQRTHDR